MKNYQTIEEAKNGAAAFFIENFQHSGQVGIESANGNEIEFYSKDDPSMDDTFKCTVDDGKKRYCVNGGQVNVTE